ncbi:MAG: hypothetical protein LKKZDAJK_002540, partial [Candidatus Fervidibacter sp.]
AEDRVGSKDFEPLLLKASQASKVLIKESLFPH